MSHPLLLTATKCVNLTDEVNGFMDSLHAEFNDVVTITCDPCFEIEGGSGAQSAQLKCNASGLWNITQPRCISMCTCYQTDVFIT